MRPLLAALVVLGLVACSVETSPPVGTHEDLVDSGTSVERDAGLDAVADAQESCEVQTARICRSLDAQCGIIIDWTCDGERQRCGTCPKDSVCGDNKKHYSCGNACDGSLHASECASKGAPSVYGTTDECVDIPYRNVDGVPEWRPTGRAECVSVAGLLCCGD